MKFDKIEMTSKSGQIFSLEIPAPSDRSTSTFIVAAHKTGSTLMNHLTTEMCQRASVPHINVELQTWRQGVAISDWPDELYDFLERPGYVFDSFRSLQRLPELESFATNPKIFLIRDPRDVAVSFYFSMLESHTMPKSGETAKNLESARSIAKETSIEDYVLDDKCGSTLRNMQRFCSYHGASNTTFFRYEDIIFSKRNWVGTLANLLGCDLSKEVLHEIADKNDIRPDKEDASKHIRQVTPGNYQKHLSDKAIACLEERYARMFERFGY